MSFLREAVTSRSVLLCVGPGGVGKTTSSAALGLAAARLGRRVLVVTIDPAKRLANSLGLAALGHEPSMVSAELVRPAPGGEMWAMMLDQKRAFDDVVRRYAKNPEAVTRIFANPIYAQVSQSLAGAHEYAAMAMLEDLVGQNKFDLIVVDTPPSRHAVDFLDAPAKLGEFIDSPAIDWFRKLRPGSGSGFSVLGRSGAFILSRLSRFVGSRFLEDLAVFLTEFHDVLGGFREKATATYALLRRPDVGVIVVSSPEPYALAEAQQLAKRLIAHQVTIVGMIANRVHVARPMAAEAPNAKADVLAVAQANGLATEAAARATEELWQAYVSMERLATADLDALAEFAKVTGAPVLRVPAAKRDIHDVDALGEVATQLLGAAHVTA